MSEVAIRGNLEIGRINIEGKYYLTVCVDKNGGPMTYEFLDGTGAEIEFCKPGDDLDGRDPRKCVRLRRDGGDNIILVGA